MTGHYQAKRIREAYLKAVLKQVSYMQNLANFQEMAFFDKHNSGVLTSHLTRFVCIVFLYSWY